MESNGYGTLKLCEDTIDRLCSKLLNKILASSYSSRIFAFVTAAFCMVSHQL